MTHPQPTAGLPPPPDPPQDRAGPVVPQNLQLVLTVLHVLLAYARHLSLTLDRRATRWGFSVFAQFFGTARLPVIHARLARGILRIMALQRVLLDRLRRGRDLRFNPPRERERSQPRPRPPVTDPDAAPQRRPMRRRYTDTTPDPDALPSLAQLEAEIRRRSIGATIADICRDLGVSPALCWAPFWNALWPAMTRTGGNLCKLMADFRRQEAAFEPEFGPAPPRNLPDGSRDGVVRMLGFLIGERWPVMPDPALAPPGMRAALRPP